MFSGDWCCTSSGVVLIYCGVDFVGNRRWGGGDILGKLYYCRGQRHVLLCGHAGFAGVEVLRRDSEGASFSRYPRVVKWTFFGGGNLFGGFFDCEGVLDRRFDV